MERIGLRKKQSDDRKEVNQINQDLPEFLKDITPYGLSFYKHDKLTIPLECAKKLMKEEKNEPEFEGCVFGVECSLD